jgi:uncharacterized protein
MTSPALQASLYEGVVFHKRFAPKVHALKYKLFQVLIDLDAEGLGLKPLRSLSLNRFNLMSFYEHDHGPDQATAKTASLKSRISSALREHQLYQDGDRLFLLTMPRVLGFVFNPICLYFIQKSDGNLRSIVYEVNNTFGDRHSYMLRVENQGAKIHQSHDKRLYVSPFMDMGMHYDFDLNMPRERFTLLIRLSQDDKLMLTAGFVAERKPLNDAQLLKHFFALPLMTLGVVAGIHWEALQLWLKGVGFRHRHRGPNKPHQSSIST